MNRRDLLKYFGIGASIVPVVGGMPQFETPAQLIEVPTIQPLDSNYIVSEAATELGRESEITVSIRQGKQVAHFRGRTFITERGLVEVTTHEDTWRQYKPEKNLYWSFKGYMVGSGLIEIRK